MELLSLVGLIVALAVALGGFVLVLRTRRLAGRPSTASLVRRRNALRAELRQHIPGATELERAVQAEARRLRVSDSSIQAFESALDRVKKKQSASSDEQPIQ